MRPERPRLPGWPPSRIERASEALLKNFPTFGASGAGESIERLLRDEEWVTWSDNWLAEIVGCSHMTVGQHRERLEAACQISKLEALLGKDGKRYPRQRAVSVEVPKMLSVSEWSGLTAKQKARVLGVKPEGQFNRQETDLFFQAVAEGR